MKSKFFPDLCIYISIIGMYMLYPSVNLKQLGISILAFRNDLTDNIEKCTNNKRKCKGAFLFNV